MTISSLNPQALGGSLTSGNNIAQSAKSNDAVRLSSASLEALRPADTQQMSLEEKRQTALQLVNKTLAQAYEKIASRGQQASEEYAAFEPLTAEKVAGNILGFIERRLQMDLAEGATQEALQARLEAGLSGFKQGFAEASEKLEALSLLSPEIKADIGKTYDLVLQGVDELRAKFIESANTKTTATEPATVLTSAELAKPIRLEVPEFLPAASASYANYEYARAREFSFELTTKEGDKVTIRAASSEGMALEAGRAGRGGSSVSALNASYSVSQSFALNVEGDLSEDELVAINDLVGRVNNLAEQFFAGDLDGAFANAMSLGYDSEQIGRFSLNLAQAEIQQATKAYEAFEPNRNTSDGNKPLLDLDSLLPLGNFIRDLLDSMGRASAFAEPKTLLFSIAERITGATEQDQQQGRRFGEFMKEILALELR